MKAELLNLANMLKELNIEKNDKETIKEVLNYIANSLIIYVNKNK